MQIALHTLYYRPLVKINNTLIFTRALIMNNPYMIKERNSGLGFASRIITGCHYTFH